MYRRIENRRLCDIVVEDLQQSIVDGRLKQGDWLPSENELANNFGVSRTAIREALKILAEQGVVIVQPGRGAYIAEAGQKPLQRSLSWMARIQGREGDGYLVEMRQLLEPGVCALAAERALPSHIEEMKQLLRAADEATDQAEYFVDADLSFHRLIGESSGNPLVCAVLDSVGDLLRSQRIRYFLVPGAPQRAQEHHRRILAMVEKRSPEEARQAMHEHLLQVQLDIDAGHSRLGKKESTSNVPSARHR